MQKKKSDTGIWMEPQQAAEGPSVAVFRNCFETERDGILEFEWSADERAALFLDGRLLADGPERGCAKRWYLEKQRVELPAGRHVFTARVLMFGAMRPPAQQSIRHGFYIREISSLFHPRWEARRLTGCRFFTPQPDWGAAPRISVDESFDWSCCYGGGTGWREVRRFEDDRPMAAAELPPRRLERELDYTVTGSEVHFREYGCFRVDFEFEGVGTILIGWHEPVAEEARPKEPFPAENRFDRFDLAGGGILHWHDFDFRAGSVMEFRTTGTAGIVAMNFFRTGYPFRYKVDFRDPEPAAALLLEKARRTLECCTLETYMDCPYYERLQYIGDSRVEMLSTYCVTDDLRLPEKALRQFAAGQRADGMLPGRFPARDDHNRYDCCTIASPIIPGFSLIYTQMLHDFAKLRRNDALVRELLPVVRRSLAAAIGRREEGILVNMPGWNFTDWLPGWENGTPPFCADGGGCTLNWIFLRSLRDWADLERHFGSAELAAAAGFLADETEAAVTKAFFDRENGCFAEDEHHRYFSEHAQVWAVVATGRREPLEILGCREFDRCGIYFSFYFLEACRYCGAAELFEARMQSYRELAEKTPRGMPLPEEFSHWRSWCHAWSANALYFKYARSSIFDRIGELDV